jgi:hypothetical protein
MFIPKPENGSAEPVIASMLLLTHTTPLSLCKNRRSGEVTSREQLVDFGVVDLQAPDITSLSIRKSHHFSEAR